MLPAIAMCTTRTERRRRTRACSPTRAARCAHFAVGGHWQRPVGTSNWRPKRYAWLHFASRATRPRSCRDRAEDISVSLPNGWTEYTTSVLMIRIPMSTLNTRRAHAPRAWLGPISASWSNRNGRGGPCQMTSSEKPKEALGKWLPDATSTELTTWGRTGKGVERDGEQSRVLVGIACSSLGSSTLATSTSSWRRPPPTVPVVLSRFGRPLRSNDGYPWLYKERTSTRTIADPTGDPPTSGMIRIRWIEKAQSRRPRRWRSLRR